VLVAIALAALSLAIVLAGLAGGVRRAPAEPPSEGAGPRSTSGPHAGGREAQAGGLPGLKRLVRAGDWRRALPPLLVIVGLLGFMLFGAIALLIGLAQKVTGVILLAVAVFAIAKVALDYARA
jgi:hypothetical protein